MLEEVAPKMKNILKYKNNVTETFLSLDPSARIRRAFSFADFIFSSPDSKVLMGYSMALFSGLIVVMTLVFLRAGGVVPGRDSQECSHFVNPQTSNMPADHSRAKSDPNWLAAKDLLSSEMFSPSTSGELIAALKISGMWHEESSGAVAPLMVKSFPNDLVGLEVNLKKKVFLNSLLPAVLMVMDEIQGERNTLVRIVEKLGGHPENLVFFGKDSQWRRHLTSDEIQFVSGVVKKYRSSNGAELLERINVLPASLVLAQGALESSWGTSRFARLGNNIFGMWTWSKKGIVPLARDEGMTHKIAQYDSVLDSVRAYVLNINRLPAYIGLREMRQQTMDSINLSKGLLSYSERREEYVRELQSVISYNRLIGYDQCYLVRPGEVRPLLAMRDN